MAAALVLGLALLLAMATHSDATYCLCTSSSETALQRAIDYACGNGADCTAIQSSGACYNPNTVRDHCSYAVNSYFQRRGQTQGSCDFSGTAAPSQNPPSSVPSGCVYQASPSTGTPTSGTPTSGTPPTTGTPSSGTPTSGTPTNGTPTTGGTMSPPTGGTMSPPTGGTTNPGGFTPGTLVPPGGNTGGITTLGPSGNGLGPIDAGVSLSISGYTFILVAYSAAHLLSGLVW